AVDERRGGRRPHPLREVAWQVVGHHGLYRRHEDVPPQFCDAAHFILPIVLPWFGAVRRKSSMYFKTADVAGLKVFYREAGSPSKPTIVLLHGFPSSSYSFHDLIPLLADRFHVIAPDYPGMGYSDVPAPTVLRPTFDDVAMAIDAFIAQRAPGSVI